MTRSAKQLRKFRAWLEREQQVNAAAALRCRAKGDFEGARAFTHHANAYARALGYPLMRAR
jgi:hypothetical protein